MSDPGPKGPLVYVLLGNFVETIYRRHCLQDKSITWCYYCNDRYDDSVKHFILKRRTEVLVNFRKVYSGKKHYMEITKVKLDYGRFFENDYKESFHLIYFVLSLSTF